MIYLIIRRMEIDWKIQSITFLVNRKMAEKWNHSYLWMRDHGLDSFNFQKMYLILCQNDIYRFSLKYLIMLTPRIKNSKWWFTIRRMFINFILRFFKIHLDFVFFFLFGGFIFAFFPIKNTEKLWFFFWG